MRTLAMSTRGVNGMVSRTTFNQILRFTQCLHSQSTGTNPACVCGAVRRSSTSVGSAAPRYTTVSDACGGALRRSSTSVGSAAPRYTTVGNACGGAPRQCSTSVGNAAPRYTTVSDAYGGAPRQYSTSVGDAYLERRYVPRRTLMYIPGHDLKKLRKIPSLGVDSAVLELEDGVALNRKTEARQNIVEILDSLDFGGVDRGVRVNSVGSGQLEEDLRVILQAGHLPQTLLVPKVDTVDELNQFTELLQAWTPKGKSYCPYLITYAESAQGLMNLKEVLEAAHRHSMRGVYYLDAVVFGSDDYCADIGAARTADAHELTYARQKVVMLSKAFRLQAIDMVHVDIKDTDGLRSQCEAGARQGYTGKQVIHPKQVAIVREAFTPSSEKIHWATELVSAFEEHHQSGKGAFTFHGNIVDMPFLRQAQNIIELVKNIESTRS